MLTWIIRSILALGILAVAALALGGRPAAQPDAAPPPTSVIVAAAVDAQPPPTPRPTATNAPFVERIISRISRETPGPYPTATPRPAGQHFVSAVDFAYMPSVVRIRVGETVVWANGGRELHDVTGDDGWFSGPIESGEYRHTFGFEGSFSYRCSVHPDMRGTIIVTS